MSTLKVFSSNRVEILYENLRENLFTKGSFPFARRIIVVPNAVMKSWLLVRLASDPKTHIAAGIKICYLDQALRLFTEDARQSSSAYIPNQMELAFLFEWLISKEMLRLDFHNAEQKALWEPLVAYLKISKAPQFTFKSQQRLTSLSIRLAELFMQYSRYGCRMLQLWETSVKSPCWQAELWKILKQEHTNLCFPYQLLPEALQTMRSPNIETQLDIFALSFIPAEAYRFLAKIANYLPVRYYSLSPCHIFWSDTCSDKEKVKLQAFWEKKGAPKAQLEALDQFLRERNAMLANFGRMGREMAVQIDNEAHQIEDFFQLPEIIRHIPLYNEELLPDITFDASIIKPLTLLQAVQADMATLRNPENTIPLELLPCDQSIQVHVAYTKHREVETLYNTLLHILTLHAKDIDTLTHGDIIVMVPNLSEYESMICSIFGAETSLLNFQLMEVQQLSKCSLVQGFLHLLNLATSRWEAKLLVQLLEYQEFQHKLDFSSYEVQLIRRWIEISGVYWGQSLEHCAQLIMGDHGNCLADQHPAGTWDYSLSRLLITLAVEPAGLKENPQTFAPPVMEMETSQTDLLAKWLKVIKSLQKDLKPIAEGKKMDLKQWIEYFEFLKESYFAVNSQDSDSQSNWKALSQVLQKLKGSSRLSNEIFPFQSVYFQLNRLIQEEVTTVRESNLNSIRFCSLLPMRALPAKVVVLMGMNEGAFPRKDIPFSLNELPSCCESDYAPSQTEFDRYLFLEAILSARDYFILSYVGHSFEEQSEISPSLLIQELLTYLDTGYRIDSKLPSQYCVKKHPFDPFDKLYFQASDLFPSYSFTHYQLAKAYYTSSKTQAHTFIPDFGMNPSAILPTNEESRPSDSNSKANQDSTVDVTVTISELKKFASNPLKAYFNQALKIYLDNNSSTIKSEEPFALVALEKYQLRIQAIDTPSQQVLEAARSTGKLPLGLLRTISSENLTSEIDLMHLSFAQNEIAPEELTTLSLTDHCEKAQRLENGSWVVPPLYFDGENGIKFKIIGTLKEVTSQGLLYHQSRDFKGILKSWPQYLLLCHAIALYDLPIKPQLISTKDIKPFSIPSKEVLNCLQEFLNYYYIGMQSPSPLIPEWIPYFLKEPNPPNQPNLLINNIQTSLESPFSHFYNDYASWLFRDKQTLPMVKDFFQQWQPLAIKLFEKLASQVK